MKIGFIAFTLVVCILLSCVNTAQKDYTQIVQFFNKTSKDTQHRRSAYNRLAYISDTFGPRLWGSSALEDVIGEIKQMANDQGFDNVHLQPVSNFTKWVRGQQSLIMYQPRPVPQKLGLIGMGYSVGGNVKAEVIVVKDYAELDSVKDKVKGKIVCYNNPWTTYGQTVTYRAGGAIAAAKYGAVGVLVRSVAPDGVYSVHAGGTHYDESVKKIPIAAITIEDAEMFKRMQDRSQKIVVHFILQNQFVDGANSNNIIFEIKGSEKPDEIILAGGHIDSWDTGSQTGANDDGGGFITVFEAFRLMKLAPPPKRTIRFIAWSGQESGNPRKGAFQYFQRHQAQIGKHIAAFESDLGSTKLNGFGLTGQGVDVFKMVLDKYLSLINASQYRPDGESVDVGPLMDAGVPVICNLVQDTPDHKFYFRYHHTAGDTMSIMDPEQMDTNVLGIATLLYILADLQTSLRAPQSSINLLRQ